MSLDLATFRLSLALGGREVELYPRFAGESAGRIAYFEYFAGDRAFVGWLPYQMRRWRLATDKLSFKSAAQSRGLRVPAGWREGPPRADDYIVKLVRGSFGRDMRGPFGPRHPYDDEIGDAAFFEQFIKGRSAKAWFWNSTLAALEVLEPPLIFGDGVRTLREIAETRRGNFDLALSLDSSDDILRWQGVSADSVAEPGREIMLDYRYATPFDRNVVIDRDVLAKTDPRIRRQFEIAGRVLHEEIDAAARENTMFTLDAVIDAQARVWFLEMNCHPMIHPAVYGPMLDSLFDDKNFRPIDRLALNRAG
jgi:hypothetical protein